MMRSASATVAEYGLRLRLLDECCLVEQVLAFVACCDLVDEGEKKSAPLRTKKGRRGKKLVDPVGETSTATRHAASQGSTAKS